MLKLCVFKIHYFITLQKKNVKFQISLQEVGKNTLKNEESFVDDRKRVFDACEKRSFPTNKMRVEVINWTQFSM